MTSAAPQTMAKRTLTIVIPAYNAEATLGDCLAAIAASERQPDELILYDDGSTDGTGDMARAAGAVVLRNDGPPRGPAVGRNAGVAIAKSELIIFVDADVSIHPTALGRLEAAFINDPKISAAFGSYDDRPRSQRSAALYANLRHHFVHQGGGREATTFWAGLGAIKADVFRAVGGFDVRYARPSIEDIELGVRLNQGGHAIALVPEALGKHCKDWGKRQLWRTDIMSRAVPWTQLIAAGRTQGAELNLVGTERLKSVIAHLCWLLPLAALVFHFNARLGVLDSSPWHLGRWLMGFGVASGLAYVWLNRAFLALLYRAGGLKTMVLGLGLHWMYHCYASVTFALVMLRQKLTPSTVGNAAPAINPMPPRAPPK